MAERKSRQAETRQAEERKRVWQRPELLPTPEPEDGYEFRWVRTAMAGVSDNKNVSSKFRQGFEPVRAEDYQDLQVVPDFDSRFPDNIEVGGLILCKIPAELMEQRRQAQQLQADGQMQAVDNSYLRQSDPRMPMLKPERTTRVTSSEG
jgi:hypothetical protein